MKSAKSHVDRYEDEKKVWDEVRESLSQRVMDLTEQLRMKEKEASEYAVKLESAEKEKKESVDLLEKERQTNKGQIEQILRLNEEVIRTMEEKAQLQQQIGELESQIQELESGLEDPENYYRVELQKVVVCWLQ